MATRRKMKRPRTSGGIFLVDTYISGGTRHYRYYRSRSNGTHVYTRDSKYAKKFGSFGEADKYNNRYRLNLRTVSKSR